MNPKTENEENDSMDVDESPNLESPSGTSEEPSEDMTTTDTTWKAPTADEIR